MCRERRKRTDSMTKKNTRKPATKPKRKSRSLALGACSASDVDLWLKTQALFDVPEAKAALRELKRLRSAIEWSLGMGKDGFRPRMDGEGQYWWRTELRMRALGKPNA
jgi:hypothetical protein